MYRETIWNRIFWKTIILLTIISPIFILIYSLTTQKIETEYICEDSMERAKIDVNKKFYFDDHRKEFYEGAGGYRTELTPLGKRTSEMQENLKEAIENKDIEEIDRIYNGEKIKTEDYAQ